MKRISSFITIVSIFLLVIGCDSSSGGKNRQTLNLEPVAGKPHSYHCAIRLRSVGKVYLRTLLPAESDGHARETIELRKDEWRYDPATGLFTIDRDIDTSVYAPVADGRYETPMRIVLREKIDPRTIRFAVNGRIGEEGKDYMYDEAKREVKLLACVTGDENCMLQFKTSAGASSISQGSPSEMTRELRAYFEWPLEGNTVLAGADGKRFAPKEGKLRSVWLVDLIPVKNGYKGKSLQTGFNWDSSANILVLSEPVDASRFSVYIFGNE